MDRAADDEWCSDEIVWGLFHQPEQRLQALGPVAGREVVELGCGTAYFSARLARAGARVIGLDLSPAQLLTARRCQAEFGPEFPLVRASAEAVPLADSCADMVVSEYGASTWCDTDRWIGEAARILRPGGRLAFLSNSVLLALCVPPDEGVAGQRLLRAQADLGAVRWPGGGVEHHATHATWIATLRRHGFAIEALHELYAPATARPPAYFEIVDPAWAQRWPAEDLWVATLVG